MYTSLHAKQETLSPEMLLSLGAQSWARASGRRKEMRSMDLEAWFPAGAKRGVTMSVLFCGQGPGSSQRGGATGAGCTQEPPAPWWK